jgi:deoxyadenosine/deoxycytidine kinase
MKKLKKLLKNNKPKFVLIYGPIGVGKLTVAQELQRKLKDFALIHNHLLLNPAVELHPRGKKDPHLANLIMKIFKIFIKEAAEKKRNIIMTHPYAYSYVYSNGVIDTKFVKDMIEICQKNDGVCYPVHLICDLRENIKRATNKNRRIHKKLIDKKILEEKIKDKDLFTSPNIRNNFKIDTTKLSAEKTAAMIKKHFNL